MGRTLNDINQSKIFYDLPPKVMQIKIKISKWDLIKLTIFWSAKETTSKVKRQSSEWDKTIAKETTDKELISKIYKYLIQLNTRKANNPIKKWERDLNRHLSEEDIQRTNKRMKRCSILLIIREVPLFLIDTFSWKRILGWIFFSLSFGYLTSYKKATINFTFVLLYIKNLFSIHTYIWYTLKRKKYVYIFHFYHKHMKLEMNYKNTTNIVLP